MILGLRDRGCTVFFSSHVLSDAEALCHRVAILAQGRLVTTGTLHDMLEFEAKGWELIVSGADDRVVASLDRRIRRSVKIGPGRYQLELPLEVPPQQLLTELSAVGARLVSLNPIRATLEDYFVEQVSTQQRVAGRQP
jgi:ABC-2 type transport system ATP-binding protein